MEPNAAATTADDGTTTTAVGALVIVLAVIAVALRFYTRFSTKAGLKWDDWLILVALLATITTDVLVLVATNADPDGAAIASNTDPSYQYTPADEVYNLLSYIATVLYFTITSATKLSILFMYGRLFSISASFRHQVFVVGILVLCFWIGCTVANLLNCRPLKYTWINSLDDPRYCFNYNIFWMASGAVEAVIDTIIIAMPIKMVFGLQLDSSKKIAVAAVFLLGFFVIVTGLVKVILSYVPGSREPSFDRTEVWTTVHCGIGIVCACLPVCWPLVVRVAKLRLRSRMAPYPVQKHWYNLSGWSSVKRESNNRGSLAIELERNTTPIIRDDLLMDEIRPQYSTVYSRQRDES